MTDVWQNISKEKHADVKPILYVKISRSANPRGILTQKIESFEMTSYRKTPQNPWTANRTMLEEPDVRENGHLRALNAQRKIFRFFRYIFDQKKITVQGNWGRF